MGKYCLRQLFVIFAIISAVAIFYGCSIDGGSSGGGGGGNPSAMTGTFVDSHVEGVEYSTPTHNEITDSQGTFKYQPGETVSFHVGGVYIGSTQGKPIITIVDLVPGALDIYDPVVTNIARFLQSLDEDENPENGIRIASSTTDSLLQRNIDIVNPNMDFDNDIEIQNLLSEIGNIPVSAEEAQQHLVDFMYGEVTNACDDFPELIGSWKWITEYYSVFRYWEELHNWEELITFNSDCTFNASQCTSKSCTFSEASSDYQECTCNKFEDISGVFVTTPNSVRIGDISFPYLKFTDEDGNLILYKEVNGGIVYERQ